MSYMKGMGKCLKNKLECLIVATESMNGCDVISNACGEITLLGETYQIRISLVNEEADEFWRPEEINMRKDGTNLIGSLKENLKSDETDNEQVRQRDIPKDKEDRRTRLL